MGDDVAPPAEAYEPLRASQEVPGTEAAGVASGERPGSAYEPLQSGR